MSENTIASEERGKLHSHLNIQRKIFAIMRIKTFSKFGTEGNFLPKTLAILQKPTADLILK